MILVTGGCGYIGSHTVVELLDDNRDVVIVDNFSNSSPNVLDSIKEITDKDFKFYKIDITNGNDYDTHDGTGVRDYIHVLDLANGHLKALDKIHTSPGLVIYNLGTGNGYSVLDLVNTYSKINNVDIPYKIVERRAGDIAKCFADPTKANKELNWSCKYNLEDMCKDSYTFQLNSISNALSVD